MWLSGAGLWERKRRRKLRRPRSEHFGELVQMDWAVPMAMIDDATCRIFARFFENESALRRIDRWRLLDLFGYVSFVSDLQASD